MNDFSNRPQADILVIDDCLDNLTLLTIILNDLGYQIRQADSGKMAFKAIEQNLPDLILLDIQMPGMDGYGVCRRLKADPKTKEIPVIFISAFNNPNDKVKGFELGGEDYITKPFFVEEVIARVEKQLLLKWQKTRLQEELVYREKIERQLLKSNQLLGRILENCPDGIAVLKRIPARQNKPAHFHCTFVNPVMAELFDMTTEELIDRKIFNRSLNIFDPNLFRELMEVVETEKDFERDLYHENGGIPAWYSLRATSYDGGILVVVRDITERKECELVLYQKNSILYQQTVTDELTQISNRRAFDLYLQQEWNRAKREKLFLALIMIDIDYFKLYNDYYGHDAGDRCLHAVAQGIRQAVKRPSDLVARYGGEEFAVILPNTNREGAETVANAIQTEIRDLKLPHARSPIAPHVTLSMGVSIKIPTSSDCSLLINTADRALYEAKNRGRDRIWVFFDLLAGINSGFGRFAVE